MLTNTLQRLKRIGVGTFLLIHSLLLVNNIVNFHSHWKDGEMIGVHAHPYDWGGGAPAGHDEGQHTEEELFIYDLISNTPLVEVDFFGFQLNQINSESEVSSLSIHLFYEELSASSRVIRGPPVSAKFLKA